MNAHALTFQDMILKLEAYWASQGCTVMQPYDSEVGAGTFTPRHSCAAWARSPGARAIRSPAAAPLTAAMARTRIACSTTTSSRC